MQLILRAVCVAALCAGCATPAPDLAAAPALHDTPFYADDTTLCGPSALAALLVHRGVPTSVAALTDQVYLPGRGGSVQPEMLAAIRRAGLLPLQVEGGLEGLTDTLRAGDPVLVLQRLGWGWRRAWHYAVVIGYDAEQNRFLLRSGTQAVKQVSPRRLRRSWLPAGQWAYAAIPPGRIPLYASAATYLDAIVGLERSGQLSAAHEAYAAARQRWPQEPLFGLGLGNTLVQGGQLTAAVEAYRTLLADHPGDSAAVNNLAYALQQLGCREAALSQLDAQLKRQDLTPDWAAILSATRIETAAAAPSRCRLPGGLYEKAE